MRRAVGSGAANLPMTASPPALAITIAAVSLAAKIAREGDAGDTRRGTAETGYNRDQIDTSGRDNQDIALSEESLSVGKRQVESGRAHIRKVVRTERVEQPVELSHEEVNVERVAASGAEVPSDAFQEREIDVPVMREEPVVEKEAHVTGRVEVNKNVQTETRNVEGDVRKEDVEIDRNR